MIVICSGTNDYDQNDFSRTLLNIKDYVMCNNHTNIVVMNIPFRYDVSNYFTVNEKIPLLNKNLQKITKDYLHTSFLGTINNRELFTNHGLHRNKLGKKLVTLLLASLLLTTLNQRTSNPISPGRYEKCVEDNQPEVTSLTYTDGITTVVADNAKNDPEEKEEVEKECELITTDKKQELAPKRVKRQPVTRGNDFLWEI